MKRTITYMAIFMAMINICQAQKSTALVTWNFYEQTNRGIDKLMPTDISSDLTTTGLIKGVGLTVDSSKLIAHYWGAKGTSLNQSGPESAIKKGKFFTFSIKVNPSKKLSLSDIKPIKIRVFSVGPIHFLMQYTLDGRTYKDVTSATIDRPVKQSDFTLPAVDLSSIKELQNIRSDQTVTFRIIPWGATKEGYSHFYFGTASNIPSLVLAGTIK